jgi:uncharacterized membrane protein
MYARKSRSRGSYVLIIGLVWTLAFALFVKRDFTLWQVTLFWGIVSGLFSVSANILLIEGMGHNDVGICATIYRLNLVVVVIGAFLLLGEAITLAKLFGLLFAVIAIFMFFPDSSGSGRAGNGKIGFYLVGIAALLRAGMGLSYKYAFIQHVDRNSLLFINGILWIFGGSIYILLKERETGNIFGRKSWNYGILSGLLICGIVLFMALALQKGDAAVILSLTQMSFLGTSGLGILFLREKLSRKKIFGIVSGLICIVFMSIAT